MSKGDLTPPSIQRALEFDNVSVAAAGCALSAFVLAATAGFFVAMMRSVVGADPSLRVASAIGAGLACLGAVLVLAMLLRVRKIRATFVHGKLQFAVVEHIKYYPVRVAGYRISISYRHSGESHAASFWLIYRGADDDWSNVCPGDEITMVIDARDARSVYPAFWSPDCVGNKAVPDINRSESAT